MITHLGDAAFDEERAGHKASRLHELVRTGANVPAGFVVPFDAALVAIDDAALAAAVAQVGGFPVAVRSSGLLEDRSDASFAGQYETYLDVTSVTGVREAIARCRESAASERVRAYAAANGLEAEEPRVSVLVQRMVDAAIAGVAFSIHPLSGREDHALLECCQGLGERLVSGHVTPTRYVLELRDGTVVEEGLGEDGVQLDAAARVALVGALLDVQAYFGAPQDIEWALDGEGQLFILQSRPITSIRWRDDVDEYTNADFKDGGVSARVCTRLMFSLYRRAMQPSMQRQFEEIGLVSHNDEESWIQSFYGRPYWNASAVKRALLRVPGFHEQRFDEDLGIQKVYGDGGPRVVPTNALTLARAVPVALAVRKSLARQLRVADAFGAAFPAEADAWTTRAASFATTSDEVFFADLRSVLLDLHTRTEQIYFTTIYNNSSAQTELKDVLAAIERATGRAPSLVDLLGGLAGVHHMGVQRGIVRLYRIAAAEGMDGEPWRMAFAEFLAEHGFHGDAELDLREPRWAETPERLVERIALMVRTGAAPADPDATESVQRARHLAARGDVEDLLGTRLAWRIWHLPRFRQKLERARVYLSARERLREHSTRCYAIVRSYVCEAGRRLHRENRLPSALSIFMLEAEEIVRLTEGFWPTAEVDALLRYRQRMYDGYRSFSPPNELGRGVVARTEEHAPTGARLQGVGCSPGTVVGTARVVHSIDEAATVGPGEILVTRFTDPGWTPVMGHAGAIVTEVGGLLSHAAVIGREYGIPAVLNLPGATRSIKNGQRVRVDGWAGTVDLLELEGAY